MLWLSVEYVVKKFPFFEMFPYEISIMATKCIRRQHEKYFKAFIEFIHVLKKFDTIQHISVTCLVSIH